MKIQQLIQILQNLQDPEAIVDIASDEEGNSFGDIDTTISEGQLQSTKETVYSLFPINSQLPEERYVNTN